MRPVTEIKIKCKKYTDQCLINAYVLLPRDVKRTALWLTLIRGL
jgi:hypothetical protein